MTYLEDNQNSNQNENFENKKQLLWFLCVFFFWLKFKLSLKEQSNVFEKNNLNNFNEGDNMPIVAVPILIAAGVGAGVVVVGTTIVITYEIVQYINQARFESKLSNYEQYDYCDLLSSLHNILKVMRNVTTQLENFRNSYAAYQNDVIVFHNQSKEAQLELKKLELPKSIKEQNQQMIKSNEKNIGTRVNLQQNIIKNMKKGIENLKHVVEEYNKICECIAMQYKNDQVAVFDGKRIPLTETEKHTLDIKNQVLEVSPKAFLESVKIIFSCVKKEPTLVSAKSNEFLQSSEYQNELEYNKFTTEVNLAAQSAFKKFEFEMFGNNKVAPKIN